MRRCFQLSAPAVRRLGCVLAGLLSLATALRCAADDSVTIGEYELKAAFLPKFPLFVQWPPDAFKSADAPLVIGIFGESEIAEHLEAITVGKTVGGRRLKVRICRDSAEARRCHIVFFPGNELGAIAETLSQLAGAAVLTISDAPDFASVGGMVNLVTADKKIRLEVNLEAIQQAGLRMDPQLLQLAKPVKPRRRR
jgi:hypothetical protein